MEVQFLACSGSVVDRFCHFTIPDIQAKVTMHKGNESGRTVITVGVFDKSDAGVYDLKGAPQFLQHAMGDYPWT
eukprot:14149839-Ditylum_brightwellii.AAC.1